MKILHVAEAWGGGVVSAVYDYALSLPDHQHILLVKPRPGHDTLDVGPPNTVTIPLATSPVRAMGAIREQVARLRPDVVHAHSSLAGVYVRLAVNRHDLPVVYTPHCYAFERTDVGALLRALFWGSEKALARRSSAVVAVSERETSLARRLSRHVPAVHVPNVARAGVVPKPLGERGSNFVVLGVGRLLPQKDPDFFAEVSRLVRAAADDCSFVWVGDGPPDVVKRMRASGVETVGWTPRSDVLSRMRRAHVYLHTAAWEGAPLTVLEAVVAGTPVVARAIPALAAVPELVLGVTAEACAAHVLRLRSDPAAWEQAQRAQADVVSTRYTPLVQATRLNEAYETVVEAVRSRH